METPDSGRNKKGFGLLILSISLATFMASLDGTIVNIALPGNLRIVQALDNDRELGCDILPACHGGLPACLREDMRIR